jgi:hypothetical protein
MSLLDQPKTPDQDSNQGQYYRYSLPGTSIAHPAPGSSFFSQPSPGDLPLQRDDDDTIMHPDYDEGYDPTPDGLEFVPRLIAPSEEPDNARIGLEEFMEWRIQQEDKRLSELNSISLDGQADDLRGMISKLQSRSSVRHKRYSTAHQNASTRSGISKYPQSQSQRGRSIQTTSSARGCGTGARRHAREGRRSFVVSVQGEITINNGSESGEGENSTFNELRQDEVTVDDPLGSMEGEESTVNGIEQRMQGVSLNAR